MLILLSESKCFLMMFFEESEDREKSPANKFVRSGHFDKMYCEIMMFVKVYFIRNYQYPLHFQ